MIDWLELAGALIVWFALAWDHRHPEHAHIFEDEK